MTYKIVGCDPGVANFALSRVIVPEGKGKDFTILSARILKHTLRNVKDDARADLSAFHSSLGDQVTGTDLIVAERYMTRGGFAGATGEYVNLMLGSMLNMMKDDQVRVRIISSAFWKNAVNRKFELNALYKAVACPPHPVDSTLMALFGAYQMDDTKPFHDWTATTLRKFVKQIEAACKKAGCEMRNVRDKEARMAALMETLQ